MEMKGTDGKNLKVIPRIAASNYMMFGMRLLQDENGDQVELVKRDHRQDGTESVTQAIIKKWLTSGAAPTRTYQHLIECLRQSELGALAEDIANTTAGEGIIANTTAGEGMSKCHHLSQQSLFMLITHTTIQLIYH